MTVSVGLPISCVRRQACEPWWSLITVGESGDGCGSLPEPIRLAIHTTVICLLILCSRSIMSDSIGLRDLLLVRLSIVLNPYRRCVVVCSSWRQPICTDLHGRVKRLIRKSGNWRLHSVVRVIFRHRDHRDGTQVDQWRGCPNWWDGCHQVGVGDRCSCSNAMATADRMFYAGLDLIVQWWFLCRWYGIAVLCSISTKIHVYQALIRSVLL